MTRRPEVIIGIADAPSGRDAVALGALMAERLRATPLLATVLSYPRYLIGPGELERVLAAARRELSAIALDGIGDLKPRTTALAERSPAEALHNLAETEAATLIVVASARRARPSFLHAGTVGMSLLHNAPCAVAVAPRDFAETVRRLRRIAVAFDGSPESWSALETAIALANGASAGLELIAVAETPTPAFSEGLDAPTARKLFAASEEEMRTTLDLGLTRVRDQVPCESPCESRLLVGGAAEQIVHASAGADLLAIGSRGYGPLRRTLLGSVSRSVLGSARCPVLVLPRAAGTDPLGIGYEARQTDVKRVAA